MKQFFQNQLSCTFRSRFWLVLLRNNLNRWFSYTWADLLCFCSPLGKLHFRRRVSDILGGNGFPSLLKTLGTSRHMGMMYLNVYVSIPHQNSKSSTTFGGFLKCATFFTLRPHQDPVCISSWTEFRTWISSFRCLVIIIARWQNFKYWRKIRNGHAHFLIWAKS